MTEDHYARMKMPCDEIGRALACSSDDEQAAVINSLAKEMRVVCRDPELTGMQVCYMAGCLDKNGKMLINALADYIKLREDAES